MRKLHRVYLIPGMFGFGKLAGYDYFGHLERSLSKRLAKSSAEFVTRVISTPPTASIRRRACVIAKAIEESSRDDDGPIHLIGHSTGGLDARLLASPTVSLDVAPEQLAWRSRLHTVITMNTPHFGTPLAQFFATVSGTRLLYALSLLTVTTLTLGGPPLAVLSSLVAALGSVDEVLGMNVKMLDRTTELLLRFIGERSRAEVRTWLDGMRLDQGGIIQISPECMDLFNAATRDSSDVRYGCVATSSPGPASVRFVSSIRSPYAALSATIYSTLYAVAARSHRNYLYPEPDQETRKRLEQNAAGPLSEKLTDGIVPTLSMLNGRLLWSGMADHLDVVGHFRDDHRPARHTDWLASGAQFGRTGFKEAMDAIASFILEDSLL